MSHTKEPWEYVESLSDCCDFEIIDVAEHNVVAGEYGIKEKANARRIVACVNACKRFHVELLEAAAACGGMVSEPVEELLAVRKQRDELHEANERLKEENNNLRSHRDEALDDAREFAAQVSKLTEKLDEMKAQSSEPVAWMHPEEGLSYENHYSGNIPLYTAAPRDEQVETLRRDAERYRWVMNNLRVGEFNGWTDDSNGFEDYTDEKIDAARKGEE